MAMRSINARSSCERVPTPAASIWPKEPFDVIPIQFVETLELDPAPPFLVPLVVNRFRCTKEVRAFDDPALGDDALFPFDPPRTHQDASN